MKITLYEENNRKTIEGDLIVGLATFKNEVGEFLSFYRIYPDIYSMAEERMKYYSEVQTRTHNFELDGEIRGGELFFISKDDIDLYRIKGTTVLETGMCSRMTGAKPHKISESSRNFILQKASIIIDEFMKDYSRSSISISDSVLQTLSDEIEALRSEAPAILGLK
jgi:hypothetical protein